jgi:hypothetical protein
VVGNRVTLRSGSLLPAIGLVAGVVLIFSVAFMSLFALIRTYVEPVKASAPRRVEVALAGATAGLGTATSVIPTARAATAPQAPPQTTDQPRGIWAMSAPPTWLASVDPAARGVSAAPFAATPEDMRPLSGLVRARGAR